MQSRPTLGMFWIVAEIGLMSQPANHIKSQLFCIRSRKTSRSRPSKVSDPKSNVSVSGEILDGLGLVSDWTLEVSVSSRASTARLHPWVQQTLQIYLVCKTHLLVFLTLQDLKSNVIVLHNSIWSVKLQTYIYLYIYIHRRIQITEIKCSFRVSASLQVVTICLVATPNYKGPKWTIS